MNRVKRRGGESWQRFPQHKHSPAVRSFTVVSVVLYHDKACLSLLPSPMLARAHAASGRSTVTCCTYIISTQHDACIALRNHDVSSLIFPKNSEIGWGFFIQLTLNITHFQPCIGPWTLYRRIITERNSGIDYTSCLCWVHMLVLVLVHEKSLQEHKPPLPVYHGTWFSLIVTQIGLLGPQKLQIAVCECVNEIQPPQVIQGNFQTPRSAACRSWQQVSSSPLLQDLLPGATN